MTLCEKCIHEEVCDQSSRRMWSAMAGETECSDFKNKADFTEVVRCGECKCFDAHSEDTYGYCDGEYLSRNDFCSWGERKDEE